ncbi:competence type IV pilus minor pilin ComGF [Ureibacillus sp. NPDC094379]
MYQSWRIIKLNQNGFTLLEALIHLVIFFMFTFFIGLFYSWTNQLNISIFTKEHLSWEMFTYDFENYFNDISEITINEDGKGIEITYMNAENKVQINQSNEVLRKQVEGRGHVPMLVGVKNVEFNLEQGFVEIRVEFLNGLKKERTFFVPYIKG